jgi:hypothetical protein
MRMLLDIPSPLSGYAFFSRSAIHVMKHSVLFHFNQVYDIKKVLLNIGSLHIYFFLNCLRPRGPWFPVGSKHH